MTRRAVEALGIEDGPSYTQLRISPGGPEVIEVAARLGGGHDAELVEAATGVELNALALAAALGREIAPEDVSGAYEERAGGAVTRFLVAPSGVLSRSRFPRGCRVWSAPGSTASPGTC